MAHHLKRTKNPEFFFSISKSAKSPGKQKQERVKDKIERIKNIDESWGDGGETKNNSHASDLRSKQLYGQCKPLKLQDRF